MNHIIHEKYPFNMDIPLIWTVSMVSLVSELTGFDCSPLTFPIISAHKLSGSLSKKMDYFIPGVSWKLGNQDWSLYMYVGVTWM